MFGPFSSIAEAEKIERTLMKAGHQSVRVRQAAGPSLYAVLIEQGPTAQDANTIVTTLRDRGIAEASIASTDPAVVRVGGPRPLRAAVELAERVRKAGYRVRVATQGERGAYVIRHGSFATRDEAEARNRELARLSVPTAQVVQVR
jgi:cell division protein FtsN